MDASHTPDRVGDAVPELEIAALAAEDAPTVLAVVDADQAARGASVIDEAEHQRLRRFAATGERPSGWQPFVAHRGGDGVGYAGLLVDPSGTASGDAAAIAAADDGPAVLHALLDTLATTAATAGSHHVQVWVRQVGDTEVAAAGLARFEVERQLAVLGRDATDVEVVTPPPGWRILSAREGADDEAVVAILAAAYQGTDEAGWDLARLRERQAYDWFRPEDLLVAEGPNGQLGGLHWLKRRSADEGEVYNLAIAPSAQGEGLGAALLTAGLDHLRRAGCGRVVLWVDRANVRAVRLYEKHGFETQWDDVAFGRHLDH